MKRRQQGYQGFVNVKRQQKVLDEQADHLARMPKGFCRGIGDFATEELTALQAKVQRWLETGAGRPTMGAKSWVEEA